MSSVAPERAALALAEQAYEGVQLDPKVAAHAAESAIGLSRTLGDTEAAVVARHALAWAQRVRGDPRAIGTARAGIAIGKRFGHRRRVALLRRFLAVALADTGSIRAARREIDAAITDLTGTDRARSEVFRLAIHRSAHDADPETSREIFAAAAKALRRLDGKPDAIWRARLLYNRGVLRSDRADLDAAEADLRAALRLYQDLGAEAAAIDAAEALGRLMLLRGDVVGCLAAVDEVRARLQPGHLCFGLEGCHAAALAQARLLPEARAAVQDYLGVCARAGRGDFVSLVLLDAADISILSGDPATALLLARRATRSFAARGQRVAAAQARALCLRAQLIAGDPRRSSLRQGLDVAAVLEAAGWRVDALRVRLLVTRLALVVGSRVTARRQLQLALPLRRRGTVADRIELCLAAASLALADGRPMAADRFLARGLRLLEEYRSALGASELRATASAIGSDLAELGLRVALGSGDPTKVLSRAERLRGNALRLPVVRPPRDRTLRAHQSDLRQVESQIRRAESGGRPAHRLEARRTQLEFAIRGRSRQLRSSEGIRDEVLDHREAAAMLGDRALVEYFALDGTLGAVTLVQGQSSLHELGRLDIASELGRLRFALGGLARTKNGQATRRGSHLASARAAAAALDRLLVEPLLPAVGSKRLLVVPTGALHALPWGALPSLRGRPVVISPSLALWVDRARPARSRRGRTALIAGPRLRHALPEVRELACLYPDATLLHGETATVDAALAALDGARLAHVACHGRFRSDSPLFSALELADGPLTVLDVQGLRRAPEILVLSACDLGRSNRHPGDELLGLSAALLAMGTRTIVASVAAVPDSGARRLMLALHRELIAGASTATALARAQGKLQSRSAALTGFVCLGSG